MEKSQIGLIGLGVMGKSLARNIASKEFRITVFNRTTSKTTNFIEKYGNTCLTGEKNLKEFIKTLKRPRKIILMVNAGEVVDIFIKKLAPMVDKNDIIVDAGNSYYRDTKRRYLELKKKNIDYIGCGISGGEEGALKGPSIMPGGDLKAYKKIEPILKKIAAKDFSGKPCVTYVGKDGVGHYVKMVHNGIEYGIMQIMAEAYDLLRRIYDLPAPKIGEIFKKYNRGRLNSYLFEIAEEVLTRKDEFGEGYLIDHILDKSAQKGTGKWTMVDAIDRGIGVPTIATAVHSRFISGHKEKRTELNKLYKKKKSQKNIPFEVFVKMLEDALYAAILSTYAQGYDLIQEAAREEKWNIDFAEISRIWEGGCIIRAKILNFLHKAYAKKGTKGLHMFAIPEVVKGMKKSTPALQEIVCYANANSVPVAGFSASLNYFSRMTSEHLPANFIQGLRDYFGAHTYERIDKNGTFHTQW